MTRRIRVKLDFVLVLDRDVEGIDEHWQRLGWAAPVAMAIDAGVLGVVAIEDSVGEFSIVEPKPKRVRKPQRMAAEPKS